MPLPPAALTALVDGDLPRAVEITGAPLTPWFTSDATTWLWRMRLAQLQDHPDDAHWIARAALADGVAVGAGGFHGGPDDRGMVEVAYEIEPPHRGRGLATALLTELLAWAAREPAVQVVRASISPDNAASLAMVRRQGFEPAGEQWDEEDGLELLFERPAR
ncbi:hypothetical protein GCM10028814_05880 [Angustibacter aerolatus]